MEPFKNAGEGSSKSSWKDRISLVKSTQSFFMICISMNVLKTASPYAWVSNLGTPKYKFLLIPLFQGCIEVLFRSRLSVLAKDWLLNPRRYQSPLTLKSLTQRGTALAPFLRKSSRGLQILSRRLLTAQIM